MTTLDPPDRLQKDAATAASRDREMLLHDIRCTVSGVVGAAVLLERAETTDPELRLHLARLSEGAHHVAELVSRLVGAPAGETERDGTDLRDLLHRLDRLWSGEAASRGLRFRVEAAADLPSSIAVEAMPLYRVLGNLICNAMKHSGTDEMSVSARRSSGGGVRISVADHGCGLSAARIAELLSFRAVTGGVDGHGLGLGIVRDLCREMGGTLKLENQPGGGLLASVELPEALCSLDSTPPQSSEPPQQPRPSLAGRRVLLAEDNQTNQIVATQMLRTLGAEVTLASDGVEALERFDGDPFDLVIVDIEMPRLSGLDVIRTIRTRKDDRARTPIVALTAYAMREHRERIAAAGADGLISKPLTSIEALGAALASHLAPDAPPRADPPAEAGEPVADQAVFDALCSAIGEDMMGELLEKVVADLQQARVDLAGALSPLDRRPIRAASHILISVAGAIGAVRLQHCARALNVAAHEENSGDLPVDVRRCMEEIDAAVAFALSQRKAV